MYRQLDVSTTKDLTLNIIDKVSRKLKLLLKLISVSIVGNKFSALLCRPLCLSGSSCEDASWLLLINFVSDIYFKHTKLFLT